jgi:amino acid adenylation domain-containing protein
LVHGLNEAGTPSADGTIVQAFERCAATAPEAPALVGEHGCLRYAELAARVHRLARHLRVHGVGPEVRVALGLARSPEVVIAMLAVLEAGGAFVPLDLGLPARRLAYLVEASGAGVVVTGGGHDALELPTGAATVIDLAADEEAIAAHSERPLGEPIDGRSLAYVLFTSGTTGKPKAVAVEHRQLMAYWQGIQARMPAGERLTWAHVSTFAADLGHTGLLGALLGGGCLLVVGEQALADPRRFAEDMARHSVDALKIVPSHLEALIGEGEVEPLLPRRLLVLGGEKPGPALLARLAAASPACRILNHYGPTETTVGVLAGPLDPGAGADAVVLGRPLAGVRMLVLARDGELAPTGTAGELHLGGESVARGYLDQPGATAERFIPDPHGPPGARMYRSGDRVTLTAAGFPRFVGRVDHQVKIRGFRVEPAEIEVCLTSHPGVRSAVVVLREGGDRSQLVAYAVAQKGAAPDPRALRAHLAASLPAQMVPAAVVLLEAFPLGPNGKIDRRALPPPNADPGKAWQSPRGLGEALLADLFTEVLGRPVGTADDFFELGGHSLLATQLISRVRQAFECELDLRDFFDHPTVAGLARVVEERHRDGAVLPPIEPVSRDRDLPLSFAQERLWIMHQLQPTSSAYNIPRVVRLTGPLDAARLTRAVAAVVERHESLRTVFPSVDGIGIQRVVTGGRPRARVVDLTTLAPRIREPEALRLAGLEIRRPFDLARGPVMRTLLVREDQESHLAVLTMHHIASDAWSMSVLVDEVVAAYRAGGSLGALPPLAVQYGDFAVWQRERLGDALASQMAFWRRHLASAPEQILPTDHRRPALPTYRGSHLSVTIEPELRGRIEALGRSAGVTAFMTLLAGFKALLARHTGRTDIVVGTDVAGRDRLETERLIGFFVNNLVLRTRLDGDPTFRELLARVRSSTLAAYGHQDLPFDRLVKALNPDRELGRTPLFQVLFVLQNTPRAELELDGLRVAPVEIGLGSAKFDLGLFVTQQDDGLTLTWSHRSELFEASTVRVLARQQVALLASACEDPDRRISALELSSAAGSAEDRRARLRRRVHRGTAAASSGGSRA